MPAIHMTGGDAAGRKTFSHTSKKTGLTVAFIPERGMITMRIETMDKGERSEKYTRVSCSSFAERVRALRLNVLQIMRHANEDSARARVHREDALNLQRLVDCMAHALKEAMHQGDPIATLLQQNMNKSAIRRPTYETPVSAIPTAPSTRPYAPTIPVSDPRKALILPPGYRAQ